MCSAALRVFPLERSLQPVDDITTEPDVEIIAGVAHSQYGDIAVRPADGPVGSALLAPFTFGSKTKRSTVSTSTVSGPIAALALALALALAVPVGAVAVGTAE